MTFKRVHSFALLALLVVPWTSAQAGWRIGIRIGVPVPFFYPPYPYRVYPAPGPVYYAPAPVYVQPGPAYVQPAPATMPPPAPLQSYQNLPPQPLPIRQ
jgi:hypothetical protein